MTEFVRNLVASAISNLFFYCIKEHELCYSEPVLVSGERLCLYPYNAAKCEQTMRTCGLAQLQLGTPYG